jgi:thymidylate synthase
MPAEPTAVRAWLSASRLLLSKRNLGGLMLHVEKPCQVSTEEAAVIRKLSDFLKEHKTFTVDTVANTIFPSQLNQGDGIDALTSRYMKVYKRAMKGKGWGRYFQRMVNWKPADKNKLNQLSAIIQRLKSRHEEGGKFYRDAYEIGIFCPERDLLKFRGRQCLSLIELKPTDDNILHMTAVYRNHYYIQKTLGNLIGLGNLLRFIATESGYEVGTLTIISTRAELDVEGWTIKKLTALLDDCETLLTKHAA